MTTPVFRLNPTVVSRVVWHDLFAELDLEIDQVRLRLAKLWEQCEATRAKMEYNTGSISAASGLALYALARRFKPRNVFEVGTFVGKSTVSLALGMDAARAEGGHVHTCDASNDFHLAYGGATKIVGYPRRTSTQALGELAARAGAEPIDLFHLDGRLDTADLALLQKVARPDAIFAIDDFEGAEKGVANLSLLRSQPWLRGHVLGYPPDRELLAAHGLTSTSTTALLLPAALFGFTNQ
jgi:predicted O-methyltransferase YrrM